jgi:hypothetical protein
MRTAILLLLSLTIVPAATSDDNLDRFCHQKDCAWSGLYWYTDLAQAEKAAQRENKPILSLRMLGNLDEELSCANSRFFRTILYANRDISSYLRENFILHWKSERPVPKVTIDFGDGRKMVRTITGNSVHYVLAPNGRVLDALPGMYEPATFLQELKRIRLTADLSDMRILAPPPALPFQPRAKPTAINASALAMTKGSTERPMLQTVWNVSGVVFIDEDAVAAAKKIALDEHSLQLIRLKSGVKDDEEFARMIEKLKVSLATDTRMNETQIRPRIRQWILNGNNDLESLNRRVYDELFLTPASDPWLGLRDDDVYSAIEGDGIITTTATVPAGMSTGLLSRAPAGSARSHR